jgi:hypothetical protein
MKEYYLKKESFTKHFDGAYYFKAVVKGKENRYFADVMWNEVSSLVLWLDYDNQKVLFINGEITDYVNEDEKEILLKLLSEVQQCIEDYNLKFIN